ncbi:hypothetical protein A2U01_0065924, partial [Trifolium medium]|nr:hypothetical protein [Trifolium medium]
VWSLATAVPRSVTAVPSKPEVLGVSEKPPTAVPMFLTAVAAPVEGN